jgi:hypothetical protein
MPAALGRRCGRAGKQLSNPIASLISVPVQMKFDVGAGAGDDRFAFATNVQPVIPVSLNEEWNVISRTITPIACRNYLPPPDGDTSGLGDITQSLFFSPKAPGPGGLIGGIGPVFLVPTATDDFLGTGKFGLGPTAVALVQKGDRRARQPHLVGRGRGRPRRHRPYLSAAVRRLSVRRRQVHLAECGNELRLGDERMDRAVNPGYSQVFKIGDQR